MTTACIHSTLHITVAQPKRHQSADLFHHPSAGVFVRHKEPVLVGRILFDDVLGVAEDANCVGNRLHLGIAGDAAMGAANDIRTKLDPI